MQQLTANHIYGGNTFDIPLRKQVQRLACETTKQYRTVHYKPSDM